MKSAGKARSNGLYRHIRTSKEIIRNLLNYYVKTEKDFATEYEVFFDITLITTENKSPSYPKMLQNRFHFQRFHRYRNIHLYNRQYIFVW